MGRTGPQLPLKKCAVIITTFFGTKPLCFHDYARLQVQWRPSMSFYSTRTHTVAAFRSSTVLPVLSLFHPPTPCLSLRGYLHTFYPTQTVFVAGLWEMWSPRQELRIDSRLSSPICCQRLLWIQFPQSLTVYHHQHGFSWRLVSEISVNGGTCKQQEKQWLCGTRQM